MDNTTTMQYARTIELLGTLLKTLEEAASSTSEGGTKKTAREFQASIFPQMRYLQKSVDDLYLCLLDEHKEANPNAIINKCSSCEKFRKADSCELLKNSGLKDWREFAFWAERIDGDCDDSYTHLSFAKEVSVGKTHV